MAIIGCATAVAGVSQDYGNLIKKIDEIASMVNLQMLQLCLKKLTRAASKDFSFEATKENENVPILRYMDVPP